MFDEKHVLQGKGAKYDEVYYDLINRTGSALAAGNVVQMDWARSATETVNYDAWVDGSVFSNVVATTATGIQCFPLFVVDEPIADNAFGRCYLRQAVANVIVTKASGNVAIGDKLCAVAGSAKLSADLTQGAKIVGIAQQALTSPGTDGAACNVLFNGEGFGIVDIDTT